MQVHAITTANVFVHPPGALTRACLKTFPGDPTSTFRKQIGSAVADHIQFMPPTPVSSLQVTNKVCLCFA
jgi:hypothetical protein